MECPITSARAIILQADDHAESIEQSRQSSSKVGDCNSMFPASGLVRYLSMLMHICMQVLTLSSLALSSCPYIKVEMELNRQFPSAFTLSGVPISRPRLCRYIALSVSTDFECRGGRLSGTVNAGISSNSWRAAYFSDC